MQVRNRLHARTSPTLRFSPSHVFAKGARRNHSAISSCPLVCCTNQHALSILSSSHASRARGGLSGPRNGTHIAATPSADDSSQLSEQQDEDLTADEIDELVDDAAGFISILDDIRIQEGTSFNACYEIWTRVSKIPPAERCRLLNEIEPGALRSLWKASMSRYVLDDARCVKMFGDYTVWSDFPDKPRQVVEYSGRCERFTYENRPVRFFEDTSKKIAGGSAWLKPQGGAIALPQERFKVLFFVQPGTGELYGRFLSPLIGPIDRWFGPPTYCRVSPELVLTPMQSDAGADITLIYPDPFSPDPFNASPASGLGASSYVFEPPMDRKAAGAASISGFGNLSSADMPYASWAEPTAISWSPFSLSGKDYVRVVAPGVYVGCAYRKAEAAKSFIDEKGVMQNKGKLMGGEGDFKEEDFVYFLMIRKTQ